MEAQLACSSFCTASSTTMQDQTCQDSCRRHSSLVTWLASAMGSSSCWGQWAFKLPCSLSGIFIVASSATKV